MADAILAWPPIDEHDDAQAQRQAVRDQLAYLAATADRPGIDP